MPLDKNRRPPHHALAKPAALLYLVFVAAGVWYLTWRAGTLADKAPLFSGLLYAAELYGFATVLLHGFMTWRLSERQAPPPAAGLSVDVFITTSNEPLDLLRKTLLAAREIDYPHATWLLDDGDRPEMRALAERLGVRYLARQDGLDAKAGNLNHALANSRGDFIAVFDADHAPQKNFLSRTLGYFRDPQLAFVQTPQDFFNLDSYQHRRGPRKRWQWTEQAVFFQVIQRGKDYWNAAFFCGSCAVLRRSALERIGGFARQTVTEDLHTSIKLHKAGFRSVYHAESLAFGIAPASAGSFLKQRIRWGQGAMQVLRRENILFTRRLSAAQKLNYLTSMATYFDGWQKGIYFFAPAVVLLTGLLPIDADGGDFLLHFLPYYLLSLIAFEEMARGYGGLGYTEQYNFSRFAAFAWSTLALFRRRLRFKVTDKTRPRADTSPNHYMAQTAVLVFNAAAIPVALLLGAGGGDLPRDALIFNVLWAGLNCLLGGALYRFTWQNEAFRRADYRFPVPLPVRLQAADGATTTGTIDNISSTGCRIYARLPAGARRGAQVHGEIVLPSGPLPFAAEVVVEIAGAIGQHRFVKAVGCRFVWADADARDRLDLFLHGSDLQWRLQELEARRATPLGWLGRALRRRPGAPRRATAERWASIGIAPSGDTADLGQLGLVPLRGNEKTPRRIVTFAPLETGTPLIGHIHTRLGGRAIAARIGAGSIVAQASGDVYFYQLADCRLLPEAGAAAV